MTTTSDKWAEQLDERLRQESEAKRQRQEAFVERRKMFREEAPQLWLRLRDGCRELCESYNKRRDVLLFNELNSGAFSIRRKDVAAVVSTVQRQNSHKVIVSFGTYDAIYDITVLEEEIGVVTYMADGAPITPDEIGRFVIENLLSR